MLPALLLDQRSTGIAFFETAAARPPQDDDKSLMSRKNIRHPE
jgi:hypothetical protein